MAAESSQRLRLGRQMRLKHGRDFARLRLQGRRLASGCLAVNWLRTSSGVQTRLGIIVGRKIGGAVTRNRARRLLRETFRRHQHDLAESMDLVLVARPSIVGKKLSDVKRDFLAALRQAGLLNAT